jgi:hypothetical protein
LHFISVTMPVSVRAAVRVLDVGPRESSVTHRLMLGLIGGLAAFYAAPAFAQCLSDTDCRAGRVCRDGTCVNAPPAACTRDVECPGDTICENGACLSPARPPAPVPAPAPAPSPVTLGPVPRPATLGPVRPGNAVQPSRLGPVDLGAAGGSTDPAGPVVWSTATASLVGLLLPYAVGEEQIVGWGTGDLEADGVAGGVQLVGTFSLGDLFAMGPYFQAAVGELTTCSPSCINAEVTDLSFGLAMRLGTGMSDVVWLGANLLLGGFYATGDHGLDGGGVAIAAHFVIDVILVGGEGFKFGLEGQAGLQVAPWGEGGDINADYSDEWLLRPAIALGLVLGA